MNQLYNAYKSFFEIVMADTPELKKIVYRIRYQVLCEEERIPGFDQSLYPDALEKDAYDDHSVHALLKHRSSERYIATVRLVLPCAQNIDKTFPLESHFQLHNDFFLKHDILRKETAEISRFLILSEFQRRKGDWYYQETKKNEADTQDKSSSATQKAKERRNTVNITLVLTAAIVRMCVRHGIKNWLSFINPAFNRLLSYSGLGFTAIGPLVEYHGLRQPYFVKLDEILDRTFKDHHDVWEVLTDHGKYMP